MEFNLAGFFEQAVDHFGERECLIANGVPDARWGSRVAAIVPPRAGAARGDGLLAAARVGFVEGAHQRVAARLHALSVVRVGEDVRVIRADAVDHDRGDRFRRLHLVGGARLAGGHAPIIVG